MHHYSPAKLQLITLLCEEAVLPEVSVISRYFVCTNIRYTNSATCTHGIRSLQIPFKPGQVLYSEIAYLQFLALHVPLSRRSIYDHL